MIIQSIQFKNLGALGNSASPILLHQLFRETSSYNNGKDSHIAVNNLGVTVLHGANGIGKTTLKLGVYYVLGGSRQVDDRKIPSGIVREGYNDMMVAITVRHFGEARDMSWGTRNEPMYYDADVLTLVRKYERGRASTFFVINGQHNLPLPFPTGTKKKRDEYLSLLSRMGVNDGVLRVYRRAMQQGQITALTEMKEGDLFNRIAEIASQEQQQQDYKQKRLDLIRQYEQIQIQQGDLEALQPALKRAEDRSNRYLQLAKVESELLEAQEIYNMHKALYYLVSMRLNKVERAITENELTKLQSIIDEFESVNAEKYDKLEQLNHAITENEEERNELNHALRILYQEEAKIGQYQIFHQGTIDNTSKKILSQTAQSWESKAYELQTQYTQALVNERRAQEDVNKIENQIREVENQETNRHLPNYVQNFSQSLHAEGISHNFLADVLSIRDEDWQRPIEEYLGLRRFWAMVYREDFNTAQKIVEQLRYRPGICTPKSIHRHDNSNEDEGTVWEIMYLSDNHWAGHINDLGRQIRAEAADEVERVKREGRRIFTKKGLVSDYGKRAFSTSSHQRIPLYCGIGALKLQLNDLNQRLPQVRDALKKQQVNRTRLETDMAYYQKLAQRRMKYDQAKKELPEINLRLEKVKKQINKKQKESETLNAKWNDLNSQKITLANEINQDKLNLKQTVVDAAIKHREIRASAEQFLAHEVELQKMETIDISQIQTMLNERIKELDEFGKDNEFGESEELPAQKINVLQKIMAESEATYTNAETQINTHETICQAITGGENLTERAVYEYERLQQNIAEKQRNLEAAEKGYQSQLQGIETSYYMLKRSMELATEIVENQANEAGKSLNIRFKLILNMLNPKEMMNFGDTSEFIPNVWLRVKFDDGQSFRPLNDPRMSGGQREMSSTCLLGGLLFAAQQITPQEDDLHRRPVWQTSPPLLLDEPFKSLSIINARRAMGGLLEIPSQIIIADPRPAKEVRDASQIVISLRKEVIRNNDNENKIIHIDVHRGMNTVSRADLAREYRGS
ncbi:MAG: hypothetical protein B6242_07075 [Anaerolineaceae bacterium 4572_78]|nr:MAG: hypothetical protein B6242_07075 [Anaerolineaceae bacterium 4572_78]